MPGTHDDDDIVSVSSEAAVRGGVRKSKYVPEKPKVESLEDSLAAIDYENECGGNEEEDIEEALAPPPRKSSSGNVPPNARHSLRLPRARNNSAADNNYNSDDNNSNLSMKPTVDESSELQVSSPAQPASKKDDCSSVDDNSSFLSPLRGNDEESNLSMKPIKSSDSYSAYQTAREDDSNSGGGVNNSGNGKPKKKFMMGASPIKKKKAPRKSTEKSIPEVDAHEEEEDDDDDVTEDGFDDASDIAVAMPRRNRPSLLGGISTTASAVLAEEESFADEGEDVEQARRSKATPAADANPGDSNDPPKMATIKKKPSDRMTSYTSTSRTSSFKSDNYYEEDNYDYENGGINYEDIPSATPASSRKETHRTLKEIRAQRSNKSLNNTAPDGTAVKNNTVNKTKPVPAQTSNSNSNTWCCGLSKFTWAAVLITAFVGFSLGFLIPMLKVANSQSSSGPSATTNVQVSPGGGMPPLNSSSNHDIDNNNDNDVNIGFMDDDAVEPPKVHSDDQTTADTDTNAESSEDTPEQTITVEEEATDVWSVFGEFSVSLPSASTELLSESSARLQEYHLEQAAKRFVQGTIHGNVRKPKMRLEQKQGASHLEGEYVIPFVDTPLPAFDSEMPYPTARSPTMNNKYPQGDVTRFEELLTNLGIHESDIVQWDEEQGILYVAHGKHIDVVDTKAGTVRASIKVPRVPVENDVDQRMDPWLLSGESDAYAWKPAPPEPFIEQLLLTSTKDYLVVIVSDYSHVHQAKVKPILKDSFVTRIVTYQVSQKEDSTEYEVVGDENRIHGRVLYAAEGTSNHHIHIVTSTSIDTERLLRFPVERLYYPDRHDQVYVDEVVEAAENKYVPLFVKRLQDEIEEEGISLIPLTQWITGSHDAMTEEERQLELVVSAQEHLRELVVVTSFSIMETNDPSVVARQAGDALAATTTATMSTAFLGPPSTQVIGSTDTHLTLSVPGHQWWSESEESGNALQEATHVLQWELGTVTFPGSSHKAATRFQAMGTVPGRLVQSPRHATHRSGKELRLATVVMSQWQINKSLEESFVMESFVHRSYLNVLDKETLQPMSDSPLRLFEGESFLLSSVTFFDDVAYAFPMEPKSSAVADQPMVQVVTLPGEEQEVPALRVSASISPVPQGFSPYLHSLPDNNGKKMLLSIGQNKADFGLNSGWVVNVWDVTNPSEVFSLTSFSLEDENTIVTWQPQTFRVTPSGEVVLPMTVEYVGSRAADAENMKGFVVLGVSETEIKEQTQVLHSEVVMSVGECMPSAGSGCGVEGKSFWALANAEDLPSLLTVEGSKVKSTALSGDLDRTDSSKDWSVSLP